MRKEKSDLRVNNLNTEGRVVRGGSYFESEAEIRSSYRDFGATPSENYFDIGFRVASIPEPSAAILMLMGLGALLLRRRATRSI